jgi:hypothetical protein
LGLSKSKNEYKQKTQHQKYNPCRHEMLGSATTSSTVVEIIKKKEGMLVLDSKFDDGNGL